VTLRTERCEACSARTPTLTPTQTTDLLAELHPDWSVSDAGHLRRRVACPDFAASLALAVRCGMVAEAQGHHPDLTVRWGRLDIELWTHAVNGLTRTDMVLAAHLDAVLE
jgi:4a-hydroxytetrahydrobiopterin dehydratase